MDFKEIKMSEVVNSSDFKAKVLDADKPVLVDFFATWCGPCKRLGPIIDEISSEVEGKAYVYKVDIDQSPDIAAEFRVSSVPTIISFENGSIKKKTVGLQSKAALLELLR